MSGDVGIINDETIVGIINDGLQGPPGPPGSGDVALITAESGESLGGHRAVLISAGLVYYADQQNPAHANRVVGITVGAVGSGESATVQASGELSGLSGLTPGQPVFHAGNGLLTQTVPVTGNITRLGVALTATTMLINIHPTITQLG